MFERYAIYLTLPPGPFRLATDAWLGWSSAAGQSRERPDFGFQTGDLVVMPQKYGFHGTLKAPFRLARGYDESVLIEEVIRICAHHPTLTLDGLSVSDENSFLALRSVGDTKALDRLAACLVRDLDHLRAPLTQQQIERKQAVGLSARQNALLHRWGYPYVLDQFQYHMTLTSRVEGARSQALISALSTYLAPYLDQPTVFSDVTIMGEKHARFYEVCRVALRPT